MIPTEELERDLLIVACAISAGIHAALAPAHWAEGVGTGVGFVGAAVATATLAVALTVRPTATAPLVGAVLVLCGLVASYALAVTTGVPLLHPEREALDGLALAAKLVEAVGLVAAGRALRRARPASVPTIHPKGTLT